MPSAALSATYVYHAFFCLQFTLFFRLRPYVHAIVKRMKQKKHCLSSEFMNKTESMRWSVVFFFSVTKLFIITPALLHHHKNGPYVFFLLLPDIKKDPEEDQASPRSCSEKNKSTTSPSPPVRHDDRIRPCTACRNRTPAVFRQYKPAARPSHWNIRKRKTPACPSDAWRSAVPCPCRRQ